MLALCTQERVSTLCCLLATWAVLVMRLSGQDAVVLGQPYSVQLEHAELRDLVGCFATPIPIRLAMPTRATSFRQLLRDVYAELLLAIEHANVPLFRIVEVFRPERSSTHNALFQTIVQLLPRAELEVARARESNSDLGNHQLQGIDLFLNLVEEADGSFNGDLLFNAAIFDRSTAATFLLLFTSLLRDAMTAPDAAMHDVLPRADLIATTTERVVGRRAELIHHGDKIVSTFEIEEALRRGHAAVLDVVAFAAPHRELGEAVGVAVVLHPGRTLLLRELRAAVAASLPARWLPQALVYFDELPRGPRGAPARHGLAGRLALPELPDEHDDTWLATMVGDRLVTSPAAPGHGLFPTAAPPIAELRDAVLDAVRTYTRNEKVAPGTPLMDAGLNSLSATQLALQLEERTGVALPPTLIARRVG